MRATREQLDSIRKLLKQMGESDSLTNASVTYDRIRFVPVHRNSQRLIDELQRVWPSMRDNPLQIIQPAGIAPNRSQEQETAPENQPPVEKQPENRQSQAPVGQASSLGTFDWQASRLKMPM